MDVISYSLAAKQANRISNLFINSETEPAIPVLGQEWYIPSTGKTYKRIDDNGNHIWVDAGSAAGNAAVKKSEAFVAGTASGIYDGNSLSDFPVKLGYSIGYVDVYLNGRLLDKSDYAAVDGSVVALNVDATKDDIVYIQAFGTFIVADHYTKSEVDASLAEKALLGGSATQLFKAKAGIASDDVVNKGQLDTKANTADLKEIGVGQTWQDVTDSREVNTTYTNSTGKPIMVIIQTDGSARNIKINGINITASASGGGNLINSFIVPDGSTYATDFMDQWLELR